MFDNPNKWKSNYKKDKSLKNLIFGYPENDPNLLDPRY
jgi:hypothetical protein